MFFGVLRFSQRLFESFATIWFGSTILGGYCDRELSTKGSSGFDFRHARLQDRCDRPADCDSATAVVVRFAERC